MRAHVGEVVHANAESMRHVSQNVAHGAVVFAQVPRTGVTTTAENDVHGSPSADRPFQLPPPLRQGAPMFGSDKFCAQGT